MRISDWSSDVCSSDLRFDGAETCRDHHDNEREDDAHSEDCDRNTPGQEAPLPDRVHILEHGGVDRRVVEGKRDLEDCENRADPENAERTVNGAGELPAVPPAQGECEDGEDQ